MFSAIKDAGILLSVDESKIISLCFQTAVSEAGSAFVEAVDEARERSETQFKLLVQEAKDYSIFMIDPKGVITSWNLGAERMKYYTAEEALGQNFSMLYREEDHRDGRPENNIKTALARGRTEEQWWRRKKDGTLFWADAVMTPIYSRKGDLIGLSKIVRDLTAKKRIEDELRAAKESAEAASSLKSIFVANMSHEIRTPLGAILGFSEVLKDPACSTKDRLVATEVIDRNGKILLRLIEDILDLSKVEAGKLEITKTDFQLRPVITQVLSLFKARANEKGISLKFGYDEQVPETIFSDPVRLGQILSNVIGNAVKFTERGEVTVEVCNALLSNSARGIEFTVTDSGAGLTVVQRQNLFSPFVQADSTATRKFGGTGLGLALSRKLAQKLGGDVALIDSAIVGGCAFKITIMSQGSTVGQANMNPLASASDSQKSVVGMKVLIVDDSPDNQTLINTFLSKWGVVSSFANDGAEGVEKALAGLYDLILMDIQMPMLDGHEAIRKLRGEGYTRPIVAVTAHAMNEEKAKAFDAGCDDYLVKPIDRARLLEVLRNYAQPYLE